MQTIAVVMGGPSSEYEVSLRSAANIINGLNRGKYQVLPVHITKEMKWYCGDFLPMNSEKIWQLPDTSVWKLVDASPDRAIQFLKEMKIDLIFNGMHGRFGEDGTFQVFLDMHGMRYTGSGFRSSSIAMHKFFTKRVVAATGIQTARDFFVTTDDFRHNRDLVQKNIISLGKDVVLKVVDSGSSRDMQILRNSEAGQMMKVLEELLAIGSVLVEEYISGREFTCGVIDIPASMESENRKGGMLPLAVTEIIPKVDGFFSYQAKYIANASEEITPANIPELIQEKIQRSALQAHKALGCTGLSRSDFLWRENLGENGLFFLETNTLPGMTDTSLLPQGAMSMGINFSDLLDIIVAGAFAK